MEWQQYHQRGTNHDGEEESIFPVFLDTEGPLPGEMIVFVIISELGLDVVAAAGNNPLGRLLQGSEELVFR